jgi:hypothetical protein
MNEYREPTEAERAELERELVRAQDARDILWEGQVLARLAHVYLQIGTGDDRPGRSVAATAGLRAIELLRQTTDRGTLAKVLRSGALAFVEGVDREAFLLESLEIARDVKDSAAEGWAMFGLAMPMYRSRFTSDEVIAKFEEAGDEFGIAAMLTTEGFRENRLEMLERAIALYVKCGAHARASRTSTMAALRTDEPERKLKFAELAAQEAELADDPQLTALALGWLIDFLEAQRSAHDVAELRRLKELRRRKQELEIRAHGSRQRKLEMDLEMAKEFLDFNADDPEELERDRRRILVLERKLARLTSTTA